MIDISPRVWPRGSEEPTEPVIVKSAVVEWHRHEDGLWHSHHNGAQSGAAYTWRQLTRTFPLTEVLQT